MYSGNITATPYLTFNGKCKEAMKFYAKIFEGEVEFMTFKEAPMEIPKEAEKLIMHASLTFGKATIMASDAMLGQPEVSGTGHSVMIGPGTAEDAQRIFEDLSEDGKVVMPFEEVFWGATFGQLIDKFGVQWMVNYERPKQ